MSQGVQNLFKAALALSNDEQRQLVAALSSVVDERRHFASEKLRPIGLAAGLFRVPDDFDDPLPDDLLQAFLG